MSDQIRLTIECPSCKGTGICQGVCERGGAYVECNMCKGTGKSSYYYRPFTVRHIEPDCKRVYRNSMGYVIIDKDVTTEDGEYLPFSTSGSSYRDWLDGERPTHMKFLGCPMLADQDGCHKISGFTDRCNDLNGGWLKNIRTCKNNSESHKCWELFENGVSE